VSDGLYPCTRLFPARLIVSPSLFFLPYIAHLFLTFSFRSPSGFPRASLETQFLFDDSRKLKISSIFQHVTQRNEYFKLADEKTKQHIHNQTNKQKSNHRRPVLVNQKNKNQNQKSKTNSQSKITTKGTKESTLNKEQSYKLQQQETYKRKKTYIHTNTSLSKKEQKQKLIIFNNPQKKSNKNRLFEEKQHTLRFKKKPTFFCDDSPRFRSKLGEKTKRKRRKQNQKTKKRQDRQAVSQTHLTQIQFQKKKNNDKKSKTKQS